MRRFLLGVAAGAAVAADPVVVVYGSTPGAITSAVAAARHGAAVTLVDPALRLGGMCAGGLGNTDVGIEFSIGGLAREFFVAVGARYNKSGPVFAFEPHVAEAAFRALLSAANVSVVRLSAGAFILSVARSTVNPARLAGFATSDGQQFGDADSVFIDATYEGDLMRAAGVSSTFGREAR